MTRLRSSISFTCRVIGQLEFTELLKKTQLNIGQAEKLKKEKQIEIIIIFLDISQGMLLVRNS